MTYRDEETAMRRHEAQLAGEIANVMGEPWQLKAVLRGDDYEAVITDGSLQLTLHTETYGASKGRLRISPSYNGLARYRGYHENMPDITVSGERDASAIAKDINRRLLPGARVMLAKLVESKRLDDEYIARTDAFKARLMDVLGLGPSDQRQNEIYLYAGLPLSGKISVSGETATMELRSVSPNLAEAICKLIKAYKV